MSHSTNAERQRRYREKRKRELEALRNGDPGQVPANDALEAELLKLCIAMEGAIYVDTGADAWGIDDELCELGALRNDDLEDLRQGIRNLIKKTLDSATTGSDRVNWLRFLAATFPGWRPFSSVMHYRSPKRKKVKAPLSFYTRPMRYCYPPLRNAKTCPEEST